MDVVGKAVGRENHDSFDLQRLGYKDITKLDMKNIIIGLLTLISISSISFGLYQKNVKDKYEVRVIEQDKMIKEITKIADEQRQIAEQNAIIAAKNAEEAKRQEQIARSKNWQLICSSLG